MEKEQLEKMESTQRSLQDYLSLGYLYLLILGIFKDTIFYGYLGVNFINYASIQDILLSPIILLTSNLKLLLAVFIVIPAFCWIVIYCSKWYHNRNKENDWYKATKTYERWDKIFAGGNTYGFLIALIIYMLFGGFIGFGFGSGTKISEKLKIGELEMDHQITFTDKETLNINLIGHNSEYLFYAKEKDTTVTITPIQGNIKRIEKLD